MSRYSDRDSSDRLREEHPNSRMPLSQGRGGSGSSAEATGSPRDKDSRRSTTRIDSPNQQELISAIDNAAVGKPSMSEFVARLEKAGIQAIPSIQSSGRLNGMSYRFDGIVVKGSQLGRAYTAQGLQQRKDVSFIPERDQTALRQAAERAGVHYPSRAEYSRDSGRNRDTRTIDRGNGLSADQRATLSEIGRFRTIASDDLVRHRYAGNGGQFYQDMRALTAAGLVQRRSVEHVRSGAKFNVVVLTQRGRNMLRRADANGADRQQYYSGFVKPAEVRHDVGIYRMYQAEAARIEREGGTIRRVVLDFELKKKVFSAANRPVDGVDYAERKQRAAEDNGLKVVEGRVVIPDLRIEFETRDQEMDKVDLELATADYKSSQLRAKSAAGLKLYAPDSAAGSPALQDPEIVAELISI